VEPAEPIHAAATLVIWRTGGSGPEVLMGQRGAAAVFMPSKYVFPGGRVDAGDSGDLSLLTQQCLQRLALNPLPGGPAVPALIGAALRELTEETGLSLLPAPAALRFIFRAITPPGRSRRFDARFFLVSATHLAEAPDDFAAASGELGHLHWIGLAEARALDLPFITEVVLAEVAALLGGQDQPGVPFFDNSGSIPTFRRLD
jgi:8-oxo-dGTP pyrophosphatase MutT (NUDIX family)